MNRRLFLSAIPGLGLLARLRGKKEALPPEVEEWEPPTGEYACEICGGTPEPQQVNMLRLLCPQCVPLERARQQRKIDEAFFEMERRNRGWYVTANGAIRTFPGYRGPVDFQCRPTFAELSRQWDATT